MKRQTVMIVDDTPANVDLLCAILRQDHDLVTANSGAEALEKIGQRKPDLILLDVMMPGLDGYELCSILKCDPATKDIPIIFVTAKSHDNDELRGLELGAIDYITKPIRTQIVRARVRNHLELKRYRDLLEELSTAADRTKKEFLRSVSHELRTPLTPIIGMTDLVLHKEEDSEKRRCLTLVQKAGLQLLGLIEDLIETSRLQVEAVSVENHPFRVADMLESVAGEHDQDARRKNLRLRLTLDRALPEKMTADAAMVHKILSVLVSNAVKFTPQGEVELQATQHPSDRGAIRFSVSDTGIGIAEGELEKIFTDFTQSDGSLSRRFPGLGLGLTLARRMAEVMDGAISAENRDGGGAVFHVDLPLRATADTEGPAQA